jgi:tetratricopeptide (TPR) repeat protein
MRECNTITEHDPKTAVSWNLLGNALSHQGKYNEAIAAYERAIDLAPQWEKPRNNKSIALQELNLRKKSEIKIWHNPRKDIPCDKCDLGEAQPSEISLWPILDS